MPITDKQIEQAKNTDLLTYLLSYEPHSIRKSGMNEYCLKEHDSLKISNGRWNWFSRGFGGYSALDFLIKVRGMGFVDAVTHLTESEKNIVTQSTHSPPNTSEHRAKKPFTLPSANINNDRVIAYLRGRDIDKDIINRCIENGTLYESAKSHNCVFVGFDADTARFACERGTEDNYKKDVSGSDKRFSFFLPSINLGSCNLAVMESPADVLSHATIHKIDGDMWDGHRLSLGGVGTTALISFLERHKTINTVQLCLDNDKTGKEATVRIIKELLNDMRFSHLRISVAPPPIGKDYNDTLQAIIQLNRVNARTDRPKEVVFLG